MREDIKNLELNKLKIDRYIPIINYYPNIPYIKNRMPYIDNYSEFRNFDKINNHKYGDLIKTMALLVDETKTDINNINDNDINNNLKNMKFILFTVINITDDQIVNNKPDPPYININNTIILENLNNRYKKFFKSGYEKLNDMIDKYKKLLTTKLNNYEYSYNLSK